MAVHLSVAIVPHALGDDVPTTSTVGSLVIFF